MDIKINPVKILIFFVVSILLMAVIHFVTFYMTFYRDHAYYSIYKVFNMSLEDSFPSLFVIIEWFICLMLLILITMVSVRNNLPYFFWCVLSLLFLYFILDDFLSIHEKLVKPSREYFGATGFLYLGWMIPYSIGVVVIGLLFIKFLYGLPARIRNLFIISGFIFIAGSLGFELLESYYYYGYRTGLFVKKIQFQLSVIAGESFEMLGLAFFMYALLKYIKLSCKQGVRFLIR